MTYIQELTGMEHGKEHGIYTEDKGTVIDQ